MKYLPKHNKKTALLYAVGVAFAIFSAFFGFLSGSTEVSFSDIFDGLFGNSDTVGARIFEFVRLPRTCAALLCGSALAVSGAVTQNVLNNRLASPSIIGVNSGAGLAVTLCAAFGIIGGWRVSLFAFLGALAAVSIISLGARKWGASEGTVILMGVAMNSLLGAVSEAIVTLKPEVSVFSADFKSGDLSGATLDRLLPVFVIILFSLALLILLSPHLELLSMGDGTATALGLNTRLMRSIFLVLAALLAGSAVSVGGLISFVGLLVPHALKRLAITQTRHLIPLCALFGAGFVTLCDTLARTLFAPYEIPVGIILAFIGAPIFVAILIGKKR